MNSITRLKAGAYARVHWLNIKAIKVATLFVTLILLVSCGCVSSFEHHRVVAERNRAMARASAAESRAMQAEHSLEKAEARARKATGFYWMLGCLAAIGLCIAEALLISYRMGKDSSLQEIGQMMDSRRQFQELGALLDEHQALGLPAPPPVQE